MSKCSKKERLFKKESNCLYECRFANFLPLQHPAHFSCQNSVYVSSRPKHQLAFPGWGHRVPTPGATKGRVSPKEPLSYRPHKHRHRCPARPSRLLRGPHCPPTQDATLRVNRRVQQEARRQSEEKMTASRSTQPCGNCPGCGRSEIWDASRQTRGPAPVTFLVCRGQIGPVHKCSPSPSLLDSDKPHRRAVPTFRNLKFHLH